MSAEAASSHLQFAIYNLQCAISKEKHMLNEQQVPSLVIRQVCDSIIDNLGAKSLRLLFARPVPGERSKEIY